MTALLGSCGLDTGNGITVGFYLYHGEQQMYNRLNGLFGRN